MPDLRLLDLMLFNYGTTNRTDFRDGKIDTHLHKTVYKEKPQCLRIRPPPLKDIHTLSEWRNKNVPTELLTGPKEIVRTDPKIVQPKFEPTPDLAREEVQRSRPRLVMTPAISMDDITDPGTRNILIADVYKSTMQKIYCGDASEGATATRAPFPGLPAPANPITLEKPQEPYVSPEWRMESAGWDGRQLRAHCDHDTQFYINIPIRCDACEVTAAVEAQRKLAKQMKRR